MQRERPHASSPYGGYRVVHLPLDELLDALAAAGVDARNLLLVSVNVGVNVKGNRNGLTHGVRGNNATASATGRLYTYLTYVGPWGQSPRAYAW